jgi:hypothetical protein
MPRQHTTNDKTYARNRKSVLAGSPVCHWCQTSTADTADHLIEKDLGGDDSLENLVPACRSCNSKRGAIHRNRKAAAKTAARQKQLNGTNTRPAKKITQPKKETTEKDAQNDSLTEMESPRLPKLPYLPKNAKPHKDLRASDEIESDVGRVEPRLSTPVGRGDSYGPLVAAWAKRVLQVELMPWQVLALSGQLEHDDAGVLLHRQSLVSVARQNGKTVALKALLGWWLTEMAAMRGTPQTVITTAHELSLAVALFQELAPILETNYGAKAKWSYGRNELTMPDGSVWLVRAATPSAGHGRSPDLIICDEIWDISPDVIDQGLMPSQRARKSPLLSMWSTAGTEASHAMIRWRSSGVRIIDTGEPGRLFFAEWSPPPGVEVMESRWWGWANPALGHTLELDTLLAEAEAPNRAAFLRASLNLWVATDQGWLKPGIWEQAATDTIPEVGGVLSVETSMDESRYVGVRSVTVDDTVVTTVAFTCDTLAGFLEHVTEAMRDTKLQLTATPSLSEHVPLELRRRMTVVGYSELLRFTSLVRSLIMEGRLRHTGEIELAEHMNRSVAVKTTAGLALSSQRSPGPIELARCLVWSAAMASKPTSKAQPAVIVGRRR